MGADVSVTYCCTVCAYVTSDGRAFGWHDCRKLLPWPVTRLMKSVVPGGIACVKGIRLTRLRRKRERLSGLSGEGCW